MLNEYVSFFPEDLSKTIFKQYINMFDDFVNQSVYFVDMGTSILEHMKPLAMWPMEFSLMSRLSEEMTSQMLQNPFMNFNWDTAFPFIVQGESSSLKEEKLKLEEKISKSEKTIGKQRRELTSARKEIAKQKSELEQVKNKTASLEGEISEKNRKLAELSGIIEELEKAKLAVSQLPPKGTQ